MGQFIDLTGQIFGRWTVMKFTETKGKRGSYWLCRCECCNEKEVRGGILKSGKSKSCGCYFNETRHTINLRHGAYGTPEYNAWLSMKERCFNPNCKHYHNYGGRGIAIQKEWLEPNGVGFKNFLNDVGKRPNSKLSLDRIENNGNYEKGNVGWRTRKQQNGNMRSNRWLEYNGIKMIMADWANELKLKPTTLSAMLNRDKKPFEMIAAKYKTA